MNVLVYNGLGTTPGSVKHTVDTLRYFLEPHYAVNTVSSKTLQHEPWQTKTSALVFPGGADLPYVKECRHIIPLIKDFVSKQGGTFVGFCAGGYFGSSRVEFCQGDLTMEVTGNRDLQFFPGIARGPAYSGFEYKSEIGARATPVNVNDGTSFFTYYNGGSVFVDADKYDNVEVLAHYSENTDVPYSDISDPSIKPAAVVLCSVGNGKALLTGPHPEFIPTLLEKALDIESLPNILDTLKKNEPKRLEFMHHILSKAGLKTKTDYLSYKIPTLTPLFMATRPEMMDRIGEFQKTVSKKTNATMTKDCIEFSSDSDSFRLYKGFNEYFKKASTDLEGSDPEESVKTIIVPIDDEVNPKKSMVPNFDFEKYFNILKSTNNVGSILLYGEVVTSTSTLLNANRTFLNSLPESSVLHVGGIQIAGRGRGNNVWVNPKGVCASTAVVSLPLISPVTQQSIPIGFVQYLAMLAYCKAITSYAPGFEDLPVRIKWPNDLHIMNPKYYYSKKLKLFNKNFDHKLVPLNDIEPAYVKVAGLLVNTHVFDNKYTFLLGCGMNVSNDGPTTSLNSWVDIINEERRTNGYDILPYIEVEIILAKYMNNLEAVLQTFIRQGVKSIIPDYYKYWMHSNQIVSLTDHNMVRAMITGITEDYGLLVAQELVPGSDHQFTGSTFNLQPDGNTFDIFKGLIAKKS